MTTPTPQAPAPAGGMGGEDAGTGGGNTGGTGGMGGNSGDTCSDDVYAPEASMGGMGGSPAASCAVPDAPEETIAIAGEYDDNFGGEQTITDSQWTDGYGSVWHLSLVNNEEGYAPRAQ